MAEGKMRVGVVGCGFISDIYLKNMTSMFHELEVVACCDTQQEKAVAKALQYGIRSCTPEQMLADPQIEMVIVLTPAPTHYDIIKAFLEAGKHVYTEKTMTCDVAQAKKLTELARRKGLYLGAAPDTFLGAAWQKAKQLLQENAVGQITGFQICANRNLDRLTSFYPFLRMPGGGICYDYGVYYLTALVYLLGAVDEVAAVVENRKPVRVDINPESPNYGKTFAYENEAQVTAILKTCAGVSGSFTLNGESIGVDQTVFCIYGEEGILKLTNPNVFGGNPLLIKQSASGEERLVVENDLPYSENSRGIGPAEMARAIREGRPNQANKELALHVLDIIESMMTSSREKRFCKIENTL